MLPNKSRLVCRELSDEFAESGGVVSACIRFDCLGEQRATETNIELSGGGTLRKSVVGAQAIGTTIAHFDGRLLVDRQLTPEVIRSFWGGGRITGRRSEHCEKQDG